MTADSAGIVMVPGPVMLPLPDRGAEHSDGEGLVVVEGMVTPVELVRDAVLGGADTADVLAGEPWPMAIAGAPRAAATDKGTDRRRLPADSSQICADVVRVRPWPGRRR